MQQTTFDILTAFAYYKFDFVLKQRTNAAHLSWNLTTRKYLKPMNIQCKSVATDKMGPGSLKLTVSRRKP